MDKTFVSGSSTLFYRDEGGSEFPVVLLHGFAEDGAIWNNQASALAAQNRLIIPDLPGSGRSTLRDPASMENLAASVITLLDHEKIETCILIGHSMGGYIGLALAERHPGRISALGLFHSTAYADTEEKKTARRKSIEFIRNNGAAPFIRQSTPNLFGHYTREHQPDLVNRTIQQYSGFSPDSLIACYEGMISRPDRTEVLRRFDGPVLFITGKEDNLIPLEHTLQQCHLPAVSHLHLVEMAGHEGMLEQPERCNKILDSFINFVTHA